MRECPPRQPVGHAVRVGRHLIGPACRSSIVDPAVPSAPGPARSRASRASRHEDGSQLRAHGAGPSKLGPYYETIHRHEPHRVAWLEEKRPRTRASELLDGCPADNLPAARRLGRAKTGLLTCNPHRSGRHLEPRRGMTWCGDAGIDERHVGSARQEANHIDPVEALRVKPNDVFLRTGPKARDRREVRPVLTAVAHRDLDRGSRLNRRFTKGVDARLSWAQRSPASTRSGSK